ncbi:MAG: outer membrane protein assembly factor BamC, partial [Duodenibacillus sp.]|nr:outer membrane protein assembly factor BamC [Duodenibacillus sp.]
MANKALRLAVAAGAVAALCGCNTLSKLGIEFPGEKIQYESSTSRAPLEVPPDLDALPRTDRFTVPGRPQVVSANAEAAKLQLEAEKRGETPAGVLPVTKYATVERDGQTRWVHVQADADRVWPVLQDFWASVGLAIKAQDSKSGVILTEWAENKADLPKDIIRGTLGKLIDVAYDTGERDQYRCRLERDGEQANIYVTHRRMVEVLKGAQAETTMWQPGPSDPQLEAEMLTRIAQRLEDEFNPAAKPAEQKKVDAIAELKYVSKSTVVKNAAGESEA